MTISQTCPTAGGGDDDELFLIAVDPASAKI
jgi:hypothetical protein